MSDRIIIVGYDGSPASRKALDQAKDLAHRYDAGLHLIHAIDWSPFQFQTHEENEIQARERKEQLQDDRLNVFPPLISELEVGGIRATSDVRWGHPADVLVDQAEEKNAFMIVIGRVGESGLKTLLFGGVASRTVQLATCPVVVVP